jgi:hypothetical protein
MRKLYGDALRKDAGFTKIIKKVARKNARLLESRAGKHAPEIKRVAQEVKGSFDKVFEETAEVVEEFLSKCECASSCDSRVVYTEEFCEQLHRRSQVLFKIRSLCCNNRGRSSSSRMFRLLTL